MQRMTDEKMLAQREQRARRCRTAIPKMRLLHGTELNIDPDGEVDWDEGFLDGLRPDRGLRALALHAVEARR